MLAFIVGYCSECNAFLGERADVHCCPPVKKEDWGLLCTPCIGAPLVGQIDMRVHMGGTTCELARLLAIERWELKKRQRKIPKIFFIRFSLLPFRKLILDIPLF